MIKTWWARACACFVIAVLAFVQPAHAQTLAGVSVTVNVRDASSGRPLEAAIALQGPVTLADFSDKSGSVTFEAMPPGQYRLRAVCNGYRTAELTRVTVSAAALEIDVRLVPDSALKTIGSVTVRVRPPRGGVELSEQSPARRLADGMGEALRRIPGLDLNDQRTPGAPLTLGMEGHDPAQTQVSLDGIPLSIPGIASDLDTVDPDLFATGSAAFGAVGGANGGTADFRTIDPTQSWQVLSQLNYGRFNRAFANVSLQGTSGRIAVAAEHVARSAPLPIDGARYLDASGLDYAHDANVFSRGDLIKARYQGGANTVTAMVLDSNRQSDAVCLVDVNALPCGYGPGNTVSSGFRLASLRDGFNIGPASLLVSLYRAQSAQSVDLTSQRIDGLAWPVSSNQSTILGGASLQADLPQMGAQHLSATLSSSDWQRTFETAGARGGDTTRSRARYASFSLADSVAATRTVTTQFGLQRASLSSVGPFALATSSVQWRPAPGTTYYSQLSAGTGVNPYTQTNAISDPASLYFDCAARLGIGDAGGDAQSRNGVLGFRAGVQHEAAWGSFDATLYAQREQHSALSVLVNGQALAPGAIPAGYYIAAQDVYDMPANCGGGSFQARNAYFETTVSDADMFYTGMQLHASVSLTPRMALESSLAVNRVAAWSRDPRLENPLTLFRPGRQLPGVPIVSGTLALDVKPMTARGVEMLAGLRYSGWNNSSSLPAHAIVDAGFAKKLQHGSMMLLVNNVLNQYAGTFLTTAFAQPLVTHSGAGLAGIAVPEPPRQITLSYQFGIGRDADAQPDLSQALTGADADEQSSAPGYRFLRWPLTQPENVFRRNSGSVCTAAYTAAADDDVNAIRAYAAKMQSWSGRYPAVSPVPLPQLHGFTVRYYSSGKTYSLALVTTRISTAQALVACQEIRFGTPDQGHAAGVFVPQSVDFTEQRIYFSPAVGFYLIPIMPEKNMVQKFRTYAVPSSPPAHPFAQSGDAVCRKDLSPIAHRLLEELDRYFATPDAPSGNTADWVIQRHGAGAGLWYELQSDETATFTSLLNCAYISVPTADQLKTLGLSGAPLPAFNYSPRIGLYAVH